MNVDKFEIFARTLTICRHMLKWALPTIHKITYVGTVTRFLFDIYVIEEIISIFLLHTNGIQNYNQLFSK